MRRRIVAFAGFGLYSFLTNQSDSLQVCLKYGCNENTFSEPALLRRLRWGCRFTLPGDARGLVILVSDMAGVSGRDDSGRAAARRTAPQLHGRDDRQRGEELRP